MNLIINITYFLLIMSRIVTHRERHELKISLIMEILIIYIYLDFYYRIRLITNKKSHLDGKIN